MFWLDWARVIHNLASLLSCSPSKPQMMPSGISSGLTLPPPSRTSLLWFQPLRSGLLGRNPPQTWQPSATRWAVGGRREHSSRNWNILSYIPPALLPWRCPECCHFLLKHPCFSRSEWLKRHDKDLLVATRHFQLLQESNCSLAVKNSGKPSWNSPSEAAWVVMVWKIVQLFAGFLPALWTSSARASVASR